MNSLYLPLNDTDWSNSASLSDSRTHNKSDWVQRERQIFQYHQEEFSLSLSYSLGSLFLCANIFSADKPHFSSPHNHLHGGFSQAFYHMSETLLKTWYWEISSNLRGRHHPNLTPNQRSVSPTSQWLLFLACPALLTLLYTLCFTLSSPRWLLRATRIESVDRGRLWEGGYRNSPKRQKDYSEDKAWENDCH